MKRMNPRPSSPAPLFVEVAVPLPIDHSFTYRVPPGEEERAKVGVRVLVPFGPRKITGLVVATVDGSFLSGREAKPVFAFLDEEPYITSRHLEFLSAAARECLAPVGEMLRAALPRGLPRRDAPAVPRTETVFRPAAGEDTGPATPKQRQVLAAVNLPQAGQAGQRFQAAALPGVVFLDDERHLRPRPDQAHLAF
jgi:primosomal protein N' (replication factor Y)